MISKITNRVKKNIRNTKIIKHNYSMDPDLNIAYYRMMNYIDKNNLMSSRHSNILLTNIFDLFNLLINKRYDNPNFIQRIFIEVYKVLQFKFKLFK
jgi:hypothetical protein